MNLEVRYVRVTGTYCYYLLADVPSYVASRSLAF